MKLLAKLLKTLLWITLTAAVCAGLTLLAWWMGWPLATGVVILLGIVSAVLLFCVLRALYRWRNKRAFVNSVLQDQRRREDSPSGMEASTTTQAWRDGMAVFDASPMRAKLNPRYGQPWFLTLDATETPSGATPLFEELARRIPEKKPGLTDVPPLIWNFLPSAVMLQIPETDGHVDNGPWESTLVLLAGNARKMAMRGIVVLISAKSLRQLPPDALRAKGHRLRERLQQVMLTLSHRFPVYVCVQDMESLPGMLELSARLPEAFTDKELGSMLSESLSPAEAAAQATATARTRLRGAIRDAAAEDIHPQGDELLALEELSALTGPLQLLLEQAFRSMPHQASPLLRGVFFCHTEAAKSSNTFLFQADTADENAALNFKKSFFSSNHTSFRPRYVAELFSHTIPEDPVVVRRLNSRFSLYSSTKVACMSAWLVLLFFVCGMFAVNTVYQHHVLTTHPHSHDSVTHNPVVNDLYAQMTEIRYLDQAIRRWPLPLMGQNMLGLVREQLKQRFQRNAYTNLFVPMVNRVQDEFMLPSLASNSERQVDLVRQLRWMCAAVAQRMEEGSTRKMSVAFPLTNVNEALWTPVTGEIMLESLNWAVDENDLNLLSQSLQQMLTLGISRDGGRVLHTLMQNAEPLVTSSRVCLSQYWPTLSNSSDDVCVPGRYTHAGYEQLVELLEDIRTVTGNTVEVREVITQYGSAYNREYWTAWHNFVSKFNTIWINRLSGENVVAFGEIRNIADLPHVQMLQDLSTELTPLLAHETTPPEWTQSVILLNTMVNVAIHSGSDKASTMWSVIVELVQTSTETLTTLRQTTKDTAHLRATLQSIPHVRLYLDEVLKILHLSANPVQALPLAGLHFSGGDVSKSPFTELAKIMQAALAPVDGNDSSPARALMIGQQEFARQAITVQAARELQHLWETEVLSSPANLYRSTDIAAMFGETGVVTTFMNTHLKPFIKRQGTDFVPAVWQRTPFPLTTDFLATISRGEAVAAAPSKTSYAVLLRSQPTLVNIEARERPDSTSVTLQCTGKSTQLINRNYPQNQTFEYDVEACGEAVLKIDFPSVKLQRHYANFAELLEDFQYGERAFALEDFPESADKLKSLLVNEINVRLLPDNAAEVLTRKNNNMPMLQDRITYVW